MARKKKSPYGEIFIALFLFIYCWWTLWALIYNEWINSLKQILSLHFPIEFIIAYPLAPIFFLGEFISITKNILIICLGKSLSLKNKYLWKSEKIFWFSYENR